MLELSLLILAAAFLFSACRPNIAAVEYAVACIIHEYGHILFSKILKSKSKDPYLLPFKAVIRIKEKSPIQTLYIALAGPMANLIFSVAIIIFFESRMHAFAAVSFFVALQNLLPIRSLDGYVILSSMLCSLSAKKLYFKLMEALSDITLVSCIVLAAYRMLKYGDSTLAFVFFINCALSSKQRQNINWNTRIRENNGV